MGALYDFLQRNQIERKKALPLVHSTEAYFIRKFMNSGKIAVRKCNVFKKDKLSYFFVGRPSFKREIGSEATDWELPVCMIVDYSAVRQKRVFPFDSGAFRKKLYPKFMNMMPLEEFEVSGDADAAEKIIGTFFGNNKNYFSLKPRKEGDFFCKIRYRCFGLGSESVA
ncbi:MAG: hypothetical protein Q8M31_06860 [Beijerinckiaceae bacterium]|nr:hypothetical protein [Beijerinckiaceae bacterium]